MCGIAGYFALTPRPLAPRGVLERMVEAVRHRGPDDAGIYLDRRAGLGHRRLSIIDLSGGKQPWATVGEVAQTMASTDLKASSKSCLTSVRAFWALT